MNCGHRCKDRHNLFVDLIPDSLNYYIWLICFYLENSMFFINENNKTLNNISSDLCCYQNIIQNNIGSRSKVKCKVQYKKIYHIFLHLTMLLYQITKRHLPLLILSCMLTLVGFQHSRSNIEEKEKELAVHSGYNTRWSFNLSRSRPMMSV